MARILVLDGHSSAALAFTRSAGQAGHWVAVGANAGIFAAAKLSRYCRLPFEYPVSTDSAEEFVEALLKFVRANSIDLVIPITDWTLQPISEQRDRFDGICGLAVPPRDAVRTASDKYCTVEIAARLGIAVPATHLVRSLTDLDHMPWRFPVVVKDRFSVRWSHGKGVFGSVTYAYDKGDLEKKVAARIEEAGDVLIQEFVSGRGLGFACFVADGQVYLPFGWKRIREVDPRGSASSCRRSIPLTEALSRLSSQLIREIGFQGIAMVEYKQPDRGVPTLMEINGRPWGSIALPIASGIDYPRYLIEWCLTGALPPKDIAYDSTVTCRRVVGELNHLMYLRRGRPAHWQGEYPNFWSTLLKVAIPWYPGMHYDDLWLSDWRPAVAEIARWFRIRLNKDARV